MSFEVENNSDGVEEINVSISGIHFQSRITSKYSIKSVRCALHTLQLAIADVLKNKEVTQTIEDARRVCKKSTVDMIERLIELQPCCDESTNRDLYLAPKTWNKLKSIVDSLIPARIARKKLQQQHLIISDLYHVWTLCVLETSKVNTTLAISDSDVDKIETLMKEFEQKRKRRTKSPSCLIDIRNYLNSFFQLPRLKSKENILQFWKKNRRSMPDLYKLASIVLAVPSTQVSVERLFSSLKYILSPLRSDLNENIINDILLIRANAKKQ
ncbi:hypothetical protein ALC57_07762 [Trachymyrmex cornetzi]|uniref:HAT C-terminal dimerisation domain-containing protein n=1 Tax=Trachymyrmex cornetzi TaxID=471704 RepID=A0A195E4J0_9HYME|nr:hypothetical protein ALC57_07762 [Trachymyrmex cornetzi]